MATIHKTIILTDQQYKGVKAQIEAGKYTNDSECNCDLIRREQKRLAQMETMRAALVEGEDSGTRQVFDWRVFKHRMLVQPH